jgi:hypothetical protein
MGFPLPHWICHPSTAVFKGSLTRDFRLQVFFMNQCPPGLQVFHWSHFEFFLKIRGDIRELMFITGVNITGVNDTGDKLFSGVNDTGEKFIAGVGHGRRWCHWNRHEKLHP